MLRKTFTTKWKRKKSNAAILSCAEVAKLTAEIFMKKSNEERIKMMEDILKCKDDKLTADILTIVKTDCSESKSYYLNQKDIKKLNPTIIAKSIYLEMKLNDIKIGETQVKYNNGLLDNNINSSWNSTAYLSKIFDLNEINLI